MYWTSKVPLLMLAYLIFASQTEGLRCKFCQLGEYARSLRQGSDSARFEPPVLRECKSGEGAIPSAICKPESQSCFFLKFTLTNSAGVKINNYARSCAVGGEITSGCVPRLPKGVTIDVPGAVENLQSCFCDSDDCNVGSSSQRCVSDKNMVIALILSSFTLPTWKIV